jgi:hypothetical protein
MPLDTALTSVYERSTDIQLRWHWTPGTSALWDNRASIHTVSFDYDGERHVGRAIASRLYRQLTAFFFFFSRAHGFPLWPRSPTLTPLVGVGLRRWVFLGGRPRPLAVNIYREPKRVVPAIEVRDHRAGEKPTRLDSGMHRACM